MVKPDTVSVMSLQGPAMSAKQERKACKSQCAQISGASATPEPSSPAPAKQHHKAFRSAGTVALTLTGQGQTVCYSLRYRYLAAGCHRDAYMVSRPRHPEGDSNRLVMKLSTSNDRMMQHDICCINEVRAQATLANVVPEMLAYLAHMTCRGMWQVSSHCMLLQTAMGDGESVARRAAELSQQQLYVQAKQCVGTHKDGTSSSTWDGTSFSACAPSG